MDKRTTRKNRHDNKSRRFFVRGIPGDGKKKPMECGLRERFALFTTSGALKTPPNQDLQSAFFSEQSINHGRVQDNRFAVRAKETVEKCVLFLNNFFCRRMNGKIILRTRVCRFFFAEALKNSRESQTWIGTWDKHGERVVNRCDRTRENDSLKGDKFALFSTAMSLRVNWLDGTWLYYCCEWSVSFCPRVSGDSLQDDCWRDN